MHGFWKGGGVWSALHTRNVNGVCLSADSGISIWKGEGGWNGVVGFRRQIECGVLLGSKRGGKKVSSRGLGTDGRRSPIYVGITGSRGSGDEDP